jgi:sugar O-acyltransferase (sialic acid O-acetyltransferase NeuD family)
MAMRTVIIGAGGHGRVVLDIFRQAHQTDPVGFLDANPEILGQRVDGVKVIAGTTAVPSLTAQGIDSAIVAIGDNATRNMYAQTLRAHGIRLVNAIHPKSNVASTARIGQNVVIAAGALVCAHCTIADSVVLNTGSIVDHESSIGRAAHICPGARLAGRVTVDDFAFVGIGATIIQCLTIGRGSVVGAGAVVLQDVEPFTTVVGVPARMIHENSPHHAPAAPAETLKIG